MTRISRLVLILFASAIAWGQVNPPAVAPQCTPTKMVSCTPKVDSGGTLSVDTTIPRVSPYIDIRATPFYGASLAASDNSTAIQAAINAGIASDTPVFIPAGVWKIGSSLTLYGGTLNVQSVKLVGVGGGCETSTGTLHPASPASCLEYTGGGDSFVGSDGVHLAHGFKAEGVGLKCGNAAGCANAWNLANTNTITLKDVGSYYGTNFSSWGTPYRFATAFNLTNVSQFIVENPWISEVGTAFNLSGASHGMIKGGDIWQALKAFYFSGGASHITVQDNRNFEMIDIGIAVDDSIAGTPAYNEIHFLRNNWSFNPSGAFPATNRLIFQASTSGTNGLQWNVSFEQNIVSWLSGQGVGIPFDATGLNGSGLSYGRFEVKDNTIIGSSPAITSLTAGPVAKLHFDVQNNKSMSIGAIPGTGAAGDPSTALIFESWEAWNSALHRKRVYDGTAWQSVATLSDIKPVSVQVPASDIICAKGSDTAVGTQTLTGGSSTASTITVNMASTTGFAIGLPIGVAGASPAGYNTTGTITAIVANTSITFSSVANPGAWSSGGNVYVPCTNSVDGTSATYFATQYTVPGGTFAQGVQYRIHAQFAIWTPASGAPTLTSVALAYNGGTAALNNSAITVGNGLANFGGAAEWRIVAQSATALICETNYLSFAGATATNWSTSTKQPIVASTGSAAPIGLYAKWSAATIGAALQLLSLTVERVN